MELGIPSADPFAAPPRPPLAPPPRRAARPDPLCQQFTRRIQALINGLWYCLH